MPEGDAVWRTARQLDRALSGSVLLRTDFRVPEFATVRLSGQTVESTVARGKHLLTRIGDHTLHTHLKMEGHWQVHRPGEKWHRPAHQARVVLGTARVEAVGFQLGVVELLSRDREHEAVGHLGPDLLGPDWDEAEAARRLTSRPDRPLHEALLDQTNLAGIGNVYAAELCFLTGLPPQAPVSAVPDPLRLVRRAHQLLEVNRERPGMVTTGDRRPHASHWVYRQRLCLRCQTEVLSEPLGEAGRERTAYWCPSCQPADAGS